MDRELEERMEVMNLPEQDRDELRRFSDFLSFKKDKTKIDPEMKAWLTGQDKAAKP